MKSISTIQTTIHIPDQHILFLIHKYLLTSYSIVVDNGDTKIRVPVFKRQISSRNSYVNSGRMISKRISGNPEQENSHWEMQRKNLERKHVLKDT